ncbi:transcriptional regulator with XRE-family HTH domain [Crossiella equi]|uniref:Transcriptional regulator with XRE-family HTH domain n=1 Tax=Crossiella equi TaxID=130796 RepID=A0ABS5ASF7_9PSEU|nr:helix-turn-helix transcriptional regulator [Crossiella equi]MBP2479494.1 transcriptional regulator with XRE-family HTH domain [Crossiella equi]
MNHRDELARFLRRRRERLSPAEVDLVTAGRRRTPGLRREEVADLAAMSTVYYARLEQGRGPTPGLQVCASLAAALRLTEDERDHLYLLCGHEPPTRGGAGEVRPALLDLLHRLWDRPAQVVNPLGEVLAQNSLAVALVGDLGSAVGHRRSFFWLWFTEPETRWLFPPEDHEELSRLHVADLRATATRQADNPAVREFVQGLLAASEEFTRLWERHEVAVRRAGRKRFVHPGLGLIELDCEVLVSAEGDQRLLVYSARPGTVSHDRLLLLGMD